MSTNATDLRPGEDANRDVVYSSGRSTGQTPAVFATTDSKLTIPYSQLHDDATRGASATIDYDDSP